MDPAPLRRQELVLHRLAEQRVAEGVAPAVGTCRDEEVGRDRFLECDRQSLVIHRYDVMEQAMVDRSAGDRSGGKDLS